MGHALSEPKENEVAARITEDFESHNEETSEQRIERIRRAKLAKSSGQPMLVDDIRAAMEAARWCHYSRILKQVGASPPTNLLQQPKKKEAGKNAQVKLTGITGVEFLL